MDYIFILVWLGIVQKHLIYMVVLIPKKQECHATREQARFEY